MIDKSNSKEFKISSKYGYCKYSFESDYVHIYNLFVYPKFRRLGKARELLQKAICSIRKKGFKDNIKIVAAGSISKEILTCFYESIGLEVYSYYG